MFKRFLSARKPRETAPAAPGPQPGPVAWMSDMDLMDHFAFYTSADPDVSSDGLDTAAKLNFQGDVVPRSFIPSAVRPLDPELGEIDRDSGEYLASTGLGELTLIENRFLLIGARLASVLSRFDLGTGGLQPVDVLDLNGTVVSSGSYFFWNFGNARNWILPDRCTEISIPGASGAPGARTRYFLPLSTPQDAIALSRDCLAGPDIWREMHCSKGTFLSDPLVEALKAAQLDHWFDLVRCRVV